jgi:hypothetical protein
MSSAILLIIFCHGKLLCEKLFKKIIAMNCHGKFAMANVGKTLPWQF